MQIVNAIAKEMNSKIQNNSGQGDCFFRALSYGYYYCESRHNELRQQACDFLQDVQNEECFQELFVSSREGFFVTANRVLNSMNKTSTILQKEREESCQGYINRMRNPTVWADGPILLAAAKAID
ncbi:MAG: hypothetical protein EZS28_011762 [Streblomastix strix]|uniref:OTU domain-containing protein n=1 Tax=Streblomastix strix TaxID=222440 RepID=A0A5J4WDY0_9EUKA|nr:MAG: hypothetical protein EZS28_011762 [Streblomastix strix]